MKALANILSQQIIQKLGWTLLHFIWQAVAVALLLAILLRVLRKSTANVRYIIACLALGLIVLLPVVTLHLVPISASYPTAPVEPAPVPSVLPMEEAKQVSVAEMPVLEGPVQLESVAITTKVSWRQRAVDVLEPALPYIVSAWFVGVFGLSLWHLGGWAQLQRLRKKMVRQVDASLHSKLSQLAEKLGVIRVVQLTESALVRVPTVVGWLRPVILLPASALTGLSPQQLEAMLAHELAHIKRFDYLVNMLQTVVEILGYYHPAVWWVSRKIRAERENCCDDLAVSISGDRVRYAKALTSMEEIRNARPNLAVAATGGSLFKRISRLLGKDSQPNNRSSWAPAVIAILLIAALAIPTTLALTASKNQNTGVQGEGENKSSANPDKQYLQELVEEFFKHNYRDITARRTIEWGEPAVDAEGNISIRYKYEATIWGKDKIITDQMFVFDKEGKLFSCNKISPFAIGSKQWMQECVEDFFKNNYRDITSRKTIEWGQLTANADGSFSIRYKYEATIWDKDEIVINEIFTFDKTGTFVSVKKLNKNKPPVPVEGDLFGPVIEREIGIAREDDEAYSTKCLIDFETGKLYSAPENFKELQNKTDETEVKFEEQVYQWCKQNGIDTAAIFDDGKGKPAFVLELGKPAGTFLDASPYTWESISHNKLVDVLEHEHLSDEIYLDHSATFIFRTIEGNAGLLQVLDITEKTAKIRYKMVKMEPSKKAAVQVEGKWISGQVVNGLQVSIYSDKYVLGLDEPILVKWQIKNVSEDKKAIIWHEMQYSPVVFEIGKKGEKKYIREDGRRMFSGAHPAPPERIVLAPGDVKVAKFDLRRFGLDSSAERGVYEVTGLYSPQKANQLADYWLKRPEFKDCFTGQISSAQLKITITDDIVWLQNQLHKGKFWDRLQAARRLAPIIGNKEVLAELEKMYPPESTRQMVQLVDLMAELGDTSHVTEVLDMYEAGGYTPFRKDYNGDMLAFLNKWGQDRSAELVSRVLPKVEPKVQFKRIDFPHGGGSSQGLMLAVNPVKESFRIDEDIVLGFYMHNPRGAFKLYCIYPDDLWQWTSLMIQDGHGRQLEVPGREPSKMMRPLSKEDFFAIPQGKTIYWEQTFKKAWLPKGGLRPGDYRFFISINKTKTMSSCINGYDEFCGKYYLTDYKGMPGAGPIPVKIVSGKDPADETLSERLERSFYFKASQEEHKSRQCVSFFIEYGGVESLPKISVDDLMISRHIKSLSIAGIQVEMSDFDEDLPISEGRSRLSIFLPEKIKGLDSLKPGKYPVRLVLEGDIYKANQSDQPLERWQVELQEEIELNDLIFEKKNPEAQAKVEYDVQVDPKTAESAEKLRKLNTALLMYANDYDDKYPDNIQLLDKYLDAEDLNWLLIHVEYLGKGKTSDDLPTIPLAYDRTPAAEKPTNVLFNNNRVELVTPERLKMLGISRAEIQIDVRYVMVSETFLEDIGFDANSIYDANAWPELTLEVSPASDDSKIHGLILDQPKVDFFLRAARAHKDARMLTAPKVTVLDGKSAEIAVHKSIHYVSGYAEPNMASEKPVPKKDSFEQGNFLWVKPKLSLDNENIDLELETEVRNFLGFKEHKYKEKYPYKIPQLELVTTKARCPLPNGQTLLIAGQKITVEENDRKVNKILIILLKARSAAQTPKTKIPN